MTDDVETHNRRELWRDAANHLTVACEAMVQAQSALEDLIVYGVTGVAPLLDQLDEQLDALRPVAAKAKENRTA